MQRFIARGLVVIAVGLLVGVGNPAYAAPLFGVTGDNAPVNPESFFSVSPADASTNLIQALGDDDGGESIAFNPADGLMYHWSGFNDQIMETINLSNQTVTNVPTDFSSYDPGEVFGSTYDPSSGNFLFSDIKSNLGSVTPGGVFSLIGGMPCPSKCRGLAFNGGKLYSGDRKNDQLREINPLTGDGLSSVPVTLAGFTVNGINGLSTDPDTGLLYGIVTTESGRGGRRLVTINPLTGIATDIGLLPDGFANIEFAAAARDHFLCYEAKSAKGEPKFERLDVDLDDQFGATTKTVKKPKFLCTPVAKDGEPVIDPAGHLVCYEVKRLRGQPKFQKRDVLVFNQFEDEVEGRILTIKKPRILCVPSTKQDLGVVGDDKD